MKSKISTKTLTLAAILTALVVILQLVSNVTGAFLVVTITLTLVPVVIGAAKCNPLLGGWLGFVAGVTILLSGAATTFFVFSPIGTVTTVLIKGTASGVAAGYMYKLLERKNKTVAIFTAAAVAPIVNTGIFFVGCLIFFMPLISEWAGGANVAVYMFTVLAGVNFLVEFALNIILAPTAKRLIEIKN